MNKLKVIVTKGLSFSGKSTFALEKAKELGNTRIITKDDIRKDMGADLIRGIRVKEGKVIEKRNELILDALERRMNIIIPDTNIGMKVDHIKNIKALVFPKYREEYDFEIKDFMDTPLETLLERASKTNRPEGGEYWTRVLREQADQFLVPIKLYEDCNYYINTNLPKAVIFDMDGTLSLMNGRNPFEDHLCHNDLPNYPVVDIAKMYAEREDTIVIILSGRKEDTAKVPTENWLNAQGIKYDYLFMRSAGDGRRDSIVKREIYENLIKDNFMVYLVVDDRPQVCRELWTQEGLPLMQFGNPYHNF